MINERCSKLLQEVIREKYSNMKYENIHVGDEEFYYEFKIEFTNPVEFNTYEQDEGAINGWQKYSRTNFYPLTLSHNTIISVGRAFYTTRANKAKFVPKEGDKLEFKLTVLRKCSNETREYTFNETLKLPYPLIEVEE